MRRIGDRQPAGEHAPVPGGELAGVQHDRGHLGLRDADLDAAAQRTPGRSSSRCDRPGRTAAPAPATTWRRSMSGIRPGSGRIRVCSSASRSAGTARIVRCTRRLAFSVQASRRSWKSRWFANTRPGSKFERMNRCERSSAPFACGSRGLEDHPADLELPAERRERARSGGRPRRSPTRGPTPASPAAPPAAAGSAPGPRGCPAPPC